VLGDVIRYMGKMPGKRILVMASSGFFSESSLVQQNVDKMIDGAIHAGIVVNTLDAKGLYTANDVAGGSTLVAGGSLGALQDSFILDDKDLAGDSMAALAYGTGGTFFHNSNDLVRGLREMAERPPASYMLGFSPEEVKDNGAYHSLKVKVPGQHGISIAARPGYFAPTKQAAAPVTKLEDLNKEVMAADTISQIAANVTTLTEPAKGGAALKVAVHVPGNGLSFKTEDKRHTERLIFITALFDTEGHYLAGTEAMMNMNLKDETFTRIKSDGVDAKATLQVPTGRYRLREVVQEVVGGKIATMSKDVEIQ
jgi:hypothetical protein